MAAARSKRIGSESSTSISGLQGADRGEEEGGGRGEAIADDYLDVRNSYLCVYVIMFEHRKTLATKVIGTGDFDIFCSVKVTSTCMFTHVLCSCK